MLLDTYAWVELFIGSEKGDRVKELTKNTESFTSIISLSEIVVWCHRNNKDPKIFLDKVKEYSIILHLNDEIAELAGNLNFEIKKTEKTFGLSDALIYATARMYSLKLLTGDEHFRDLEDIVML